MNSFVDPGDGEDFPGLRPRRKRRGAPVPPAPSLFDSFKEAPPTPFQIKSPTSIDAASEIKPETQAKRRDLVFACVKGAPRGLARFQIAAALGIPDHWCSSSVDALIKMGKIEESSRTTENPASGKACSILVWIEKADMEGAA